MVSTVGSAPGSGAEDPSQQPMLPRPVSRTGWIAELIAAWGYVQRNYYLTKRYLGWEIVWLLYTTANALSIGFIGAGVGSVEGGIVADTARLTTFLLVGALLWSYLSMLFNVLAETVMWERWEGTIEYTFMAPASRSTHLVGMGIFAIAYGILRTILVLIAVNFFFDMDLSQANYGASLALLVIASVPLIGLGIMASVMPLLSPEKGEQVTFIFASALLLISGVYYPIDVLPQWMQVLAMGSPVYYALDGLRATLVEGESLSNQWHNIWPLLIMGVLFIPLGIRIFGAGEHFAKKTGRLKRSG